MLYRLRDFRVGSYRAAPATSDLGAPGVRRKLLADCGQPIGKIFQIIDSIAGQRICAKFVGFISQ